MYKILITTVTRDRHGVAPNIVTTVVDFDTIGQAERAAKAINSQPEYHTIHQIARHLF